MTTKERIKDIIYNKFGKMVHDYIIDETANEIDDIVNHKAQVYLTIQQAATYLNVHPLTLRNWEKAGKIKVTRTPGGHRRFKKEDLENVGEKK